MRLRKPCEHGRYDWHQWLDRACPGGEFLPEGALVIEKDVEGIELLARAWHTAQEQHRAKPTYWEEQSADYQADRRTKALNLFDALASQVGESE